MYWRKKGWRYQALVLSSPAFTCTQNAIFFFRSTDWPTFTRGRGMGNETFYWDSLIRTKLAFWFPSSLPRPDSSFPHIFFNLTYLLLTSLIISVSFSLPPHKSFLSHLKPTRRNSFWKMPENFYLTVTCTLNDKNWDGLKAQHVTLIIFKQSRNDKNQW